MIKQSFVFAISDFDIGGVTTSLKNLTNVLVKEGHRIAIVNLPKVKELPNGFNNKIELIELKGKALYYNLNGNDIKKAKFFKKILLIFLAIIKKILNKTDLWQKFIFSKVKISGFDVAVGFRQSPLCYRFVSNCTDAKVKIGFWHGDPDYMEGIDEWACTIKYLDYVACVSHAVRDKMKERYPQFQEKMKTVYNIFNSDEIIAKSKEFSPNYSKNTFNIVTVARIEFTQKQLNFIPQIAKKIKEDGFSFHWTVVGGGEDFCKLQNLIEENDVRNEVELVGNQRNPYPYIKCVDLFVLTSIWEAYGMVLTESLILNTPCVAGRFSCLNEIIEDGVNGLIAENNISGIYLKIKQVLKEKELYKKLKENAKNFKYDYSIAYNQLINLTKKEQYERTKI